MTKTVRFHPAIPGSTSVKIKYDAMAKAAKQTTIPKAILTNLKFITTKNPQKHLGIY
jgi:hypothetical protein